MAPLLVPVRSNHKDGRASVLNQRVEAEAKAYLPHEKRNRHKIKKNKKEGFDGKMNTIRLKKL